MKSIKIKTKVLNSSGGILPPLQGIYEIAEDSPCKCGDCRASRVGIEVRIGDSGALYIEDIFDKSNLKGALGVEAGCKAIKKEIGDFIKVKLNDSYTAIVTKRGIEVGCQVFPFSIISALEDAAHKITKANAKLHKKKK